MTTTKYTPGPYWGEPKPDIASECEEAAAHWRALATAEEERMTWDPCALPSIVASRAAIYRETADRLDHRAAITRATVQP